MSVSNPTPGAVSTHETTGVIPALSRGNLILLGLLLIQLALSIYLFWPSDQVRTGGEPLLANVTPDAVTELTISDNDANSVSFVKEGGVWTLAGSDGYPAREEKITQTLDKLITVASDRLVTQTAGSHDRLQVAENNFVRKVEITTGSGAQTLYFGTSSGVSATHVRVANSDATYLTSDIATWELDTLTTTWIEVAYYQVPKEQIQEVTLQNAHGTLTFVRDEASGEWTLADAQEGEPVAPANINTLIDRIATLNLHSVLGKSDAPEYGLDSPLATITVTASGSTTGTVAAESKTTTLIVGAKDEETDTYTLKSSDSDYYVRLAAFTGDEFVSKQRSDFMVQETDAGESTSDSAEAAPLVDVPGLEVTEISTGTEEIENQTPATATTGVPVTSTVPITSPVESDEELESSEVTTDTTSVEDE